MNSSLAEIRERVEANYFMCSHAASIFDATSLLALVDAMAKVLEYYGDKYQCCGPSCCLNPDPARALLTRLKGE